MWAVAALGYSTPMSTGGRRRLLAALAAIAVVFSLSVSCSRSQSPSEPPTGNVAGLPITHFDSGFKPDAPQTSVTVENTDNSEMDRIAGATVEDVTAYWTEQL